MESDPLAIGGEERRDRILCSEHRAPVELVEGAQLQTALSTAGVLHDRHDRTPVRREGERRISALILLQRMRGRRLEREPHHLRLHQTAPADHHAGRDPDREHQHGRGCHGPAREARARHRRRRVRRHRCAGASRRAPERRILDCLSEQRGGREPVGGQLRQRGLDRRLHVHRDRRALYAHRARVLGHDPRHDRLRGGSCERRLAHQHFIRHRAKRIDVALGRDVALPHCLLGAHVLRRAERHPRLGHPPAGGVRRREGDAEVGHQRAAVVQQDVLRLDVALHDPPAVRVVERAGDLGGDAHRVGNRELLLAVQPVAQRLALHVRHHIEEEAVGLARVVQRKDMRMLQIRRDLDLGEKPVGADHRCQFGA